MKWCVECGALQSGSDSCQVCGSGYERFAPLGFEDLYKAYARPLRRFVRRLAADRGIPESLADTDGVVHGTFVVLLSGSGEPIRNPAAWLFTVARNQLSKAAAAQRRITPGDPADHLDGGAVWATIASPPADAEDIRAAREVMHEIAGLPGHQRIATYLRQVQGWSLAEIGAYLNCAASTAGVHITRGTARVRSSTFDGVLCSRVELPEEREARRVSSRIGRLVARAAAAVFAAVVTAAVIAHSARLPRWVAAAMAAALSALLIWPAVIGWRRDPAVVAWRHQRRFNRWLRTGQALDPPGGTRQP
jgi:RNA polymerase sigma factor (sigma-70 family)